MNINFSEKLRNLKPIKTFGLSRFNSYETFCPKTMQLAVQAIDSFPNLDLSRWNLFSVSKELGSACVHSEHRLDIVDALALNIGTEVDVLYSFIHELRHIEQNQTGRLTYDYIDDIAYWDGKRIKNVITWDDYITLPQELDANKYTLNHPLIRDRISGISCYSKVVFMTIRYLKLIRNMDISHESFQVA
jgi:hypothetical protein